MKDGPVSELGIPKYLPRYLVTDVASCSDDHAADSATRFYFKSLVIVCNAIGNLRRPQRIFKQSFEQVLCSPVMVPRYSVVVGGVGSGLIQYHMQHKYLGTHLLWLEGIRYF